MGKKMKLPFLNKTSSSSFSSNSSSSSSSWIWPSWHQQTPKKSSSKASFIVSYKPKYVYEPEPPPRSFNSSSSSSSTNHTMENPPEIESIGSVIKSLKSSKRLTFERRGKSNSIREEATKSEHNEEEGIMFLSLESNDPYNDFKKSMEDMVEAHSLQHVWRSLEKLLFWFLKVNVNTSHRYIYAAFVDLFVHLAVGFSKDVAGDPSSDVVVEDSPPSSPISFYMSYSSSDETSLTSVRLFPETSIGEKSKDVCCLSSLFELEEKIKDNIDSNGYVSS